MLTKIDDDIPDTLIMYYVRRRLASEGIVLLGVCVSVCVRSAAYSRRAEPRLHAALVSAAKIMRGIQCCLVKLVWSRPWILSADTV